MKKQPLHLLAIVMLTILLISCDKTKENDWQEENLQGKVRSYTETQYQAEKRFEKIEKAEIVGIQKTEYNIAGNKTEIKIYDANKSLIDKLTYQYDQKRNQVEEKWHTPNGSLDSKLIYQYDKKGNKTEVKIYNSDENLHSKRTYLYDKKGNKTEENWYKSDGVLDIKLTYQYDNKGNKTEIKVYDTNGNLTDKTTYQYELNKQGDWVREVTFRDDTPIEIREREYQYYD